MQLITLGVFLLVISLIAGGVTAVFITLNTYHQVITYDAEMTLVNNREVGFNVANDRIYFGRISVPGMSTRDIIIKNPLNEPTKVEFSAEGDIAPFVYFPNQGFTIKPLEETQFTVEARVPEKTPLGKYTGKVTIFFKKIR